MKHKKRQEQYSCVHTLIHTCSPCLLYIDFIKIKVKISLKLQVFRHTHVNRDIYFIENIEMHRLVDKKIYYYD